MLRNENRDVDRERDSNCIGSFCCPGGGVDGQGWYATQMAYSHLRHARSFWNCDSSSTKELAAANVLGSIMDLLAAHLFLICLVFGIVLREFNVIGLLWWCPIAFIETLVLLGWEQRVERRLRAGTKS
jgi:hypothetical protein